HRDRAHQARPGAGEDRDSGARYVYRTGCAAIRNLDRRIGAPPGHAQGGHRSPGARLQVNIMKLTRRQLATALTSAAARAQTTPGPPATPQDELKAARDRVKANGATLDKQEVPVAVEPAFQ